MQRYPIDSQGFPERPLNDESRNWLEAIQRPDSLEKFSYQDLIQSLTIDGYQSESGGELTMGWGRKVGDDMVHAKTGCLFVSSDNKLVSFSIGGHGAYAAVILVEDYDHPTSEELEGLEIYNDPSSPSVEVSSKRTEQFMQKCQLSQPSVSLARETEEQRAGFLYRLRKIFHR